MITTTQFDHLCQLCKLSFTPEETIKLIHQMDDILDLVGKLQDVPLTPHHQSDTHIWHLHTKIIQSNYADRILKNSPHQTPNRLITV